MVIPLIKINLEFFSSISLESNLPILQKLPTSPNYVSGEAAHNVNHETNFIFFIILTIYILVLSLLLLRFSFNLYKLYKSQKRHPAIKYGDYQIILLSGDFVPYSFLNRIYVSKESWENKEVNKAMIKHEIYHIQKRHSLDLIFVEMLQIIFWFNPIIILYKRAIRLNHEYQVDQKVINDLGNVQYYQEMLLSAASKKFYKQFASGFDASFIKSRILMMTSKPSTVQFRIKMFLIVPFILLLTGSLVISQDFSGDILSNPYFIKMVYPKINGNWIGEGNFLWSPSLNKEIGTVSISIQISDDLEISGTIGDASFENASIQIANYGLQIEGKLIGKIKNDHPLKKQYVIFLLELPEIDYNTLDANFHLTTNLKWDKHFRVGEVLFSKVDK